MKTIIIILTALILTSCASKKLPPNTLIIYWQGKSMLVTITDTSAKENYQPVYLKNK